MGGLKRKIPTEKIEKKEAKSVAFSKRRKGLYSKASHLCVLSDAQLAILATPPCPNSNVSFYSFGHSSVDSVVSAFLKDQYPREVHLGGSEFWWEDERLAESEDPKELSEAVDSISRMVQNLKRLRSEASASRGDPKKKKKQVVDQSQTLNLQSACASSSCIHEDLPENLPGLVKNTKEEDQIVAVSDKNNKEVDGNQTLGCIQDVSPEIMEAFVNNSEQKDQIGASSDSINSNNGLLGNLDGFDQVLDIDGDFIDFQGLVENCKEEDHIVVDDNKDVVTQGTHQELDGNQTLGCIPDVSREMIEAFVNSSEQKDHGASSDSISNNNLDGISQVFDFDDDDFFDFEMDSEGLITTDSAGPGFHGA